MNAKEFKASVRIYKDAEDIAEQLTKLAIGSALDSDGRHWVMEAVVSLEGMIHLLRKAAREGVQ